MRIPPMTRWRSSIANIPRGSHSLGEVTLAGTIAKSHGISSERARIYGQWAVVYLVSGNGSYQDERGTKMKVKPGDVILVFPELAHSYGPDPGGEWNELYVSFKGPVFEVWRDSRLFDVRSPVFPWLSPERGLPLLQEFFTLLGRRGIQMLEVTGHWQCLLARLFTRHPFISHEGVQPKWFLRALDTLERNAIVNDTELRAVATQCGMGYESFRKKFTMIAGPPPGRYALSRRIERSRSLLARSHYTNKELAELLGFHDEFHFAKTFRKMTGLTPRQYYALGHDTE